MRKYSLIAILALAVLYPGFAWLMGFAIESRVSLTAEQLNAQTPYLSVVKQQFQRGWFSSVHDVTLAVGAGPLAAFPPFAGAGVKTDDKPLQVTVHSVIHHGPICGPRCLGLARVDSRLLFDDVVRATIARFYGATEPVKMTSRLGFLGGGTTTISSPALKQVVPDEGGQFSWDGLELTLAYTNHNDSFDLQGSAPLVTLTRPDGSHLEVRAITLTSINKRVLPLLYGSNLDFTIDRIVWSGPQGINSTTIDRVAYLARTSTDAGFMDMAFQFGSGDINSASWRLKGVHFDFTLKHLQMQALEAINQKMQALNQQQGSAAAANSGTLLAAIKGPAVDLLLQHPEIRFEQISVATNTGRALLSGVLRLHDVTAADFADDTNPKALVTKMEADLDLSIDDGALAELPGAVSRADSQLQPMLQQGFLSHANGRWQTKIRYALGQLTLNGKAFPPAAGGKTSPPGAGLPQ